METTFLNEYFPASVFLKKIYEILNFKQREGESLGDAYKIFKRLLVAYPTHNLYQIEQMQMFVNRLRLKTKQLIDTTAGGSSNFTTTIGIKKIIEAIVENEYLELYDRSTSKPKGVFDLKLATHAIKLEDWVAAEVEKRLKAINVGIQQVAQVQQTTVIICELYGVGIQQVGIQASSSRQ